MITLGINVTAKYIILGLLCVVLFFTLQAFLPSWHITIPTFKRASRIIISMLVFIGFLGFILNLQNVSDNMINIAESGDRDYELAFMQGSVSNLLYFLNQISAPVILICFLITHLRIFKFMLIAVFLMLIFHGTRSSLIYPFATCLIIYIIMHGFTFIRQKKFLFMIVLVFIIFQSVTILRNIVEVMQQNLSFVEILTYRNMDILFYIAGGFINLNEELKALNSYSYGIEQFGFFIKPFQLLLDVNVEVQQTYALWDKSFNVGTALRASLRDFGYIGVAFVILIHSLILVVTAVLHNYFKSVFSLTAYAISGSFLLFIFFSDQFLKPLNMYFIVILLVCCVLERFVWKSIRKNNNKS